MIRHLGAWGAGVLLAATCAVAGATDCQEIVTNIVVHSNGNIYFTTDQTCSLNWCQLNWSADAVKKGLAMLATAQATSRPVRFTWAAITACTQKNAIYASPDYFQISPQ